MVGSPIFLKPRRNSFGVFSGPSGKHRTAIAWWLNLVLVLPAMFLSLPVSAQGTTFTVTNTSDSGAGSLRQAITDANNNAGADTIAFNIPGGGVHTISPFTPLPTVTEAVTIDGYTQPGSSPNTLAVGDNAVLLIEISGASVSGNFTNGLELQGGNNTIRGLTINRFPENGIQVLFGDPGGNTISGNFIGCDPGGTIALPNGTGGVYFNRSPNNVIGGTTPATRNVVSGNGIPDSGNTAPGISISGDVNSSVAGNLIQGNYVGVTASGTAALPNQSEGIALYGVTQTTIGGSSSAARNIVSGNVGHGIALNTATDSQVQGNYVGTDASGTLKIGNGSNHAGVSIINSAGNKIGGAATGEGNLISGNTGNGIEISDNAFGAAVNNLVLGNFIGTDKNGSAALGNAKYGIQFISGSPSNNIIGGTAPGSGNVISGNSLYGIAISGSNPSGNLIQGNLIGTNAAGLAAVGNGAGIGLFAGSNNQIGGTTIQARNIISGNTANGIAIVLAGPGQIIQGNLIGTDGSGSVALGNGLAGILIDTATNQTIGGTSAGAGNIISFNGVGVMIGAPNATKNAIEGNSIYGNTGVNTSGLGIDLGSPGVTPNDAGDADAGPNNLQNYPVISSAIFSAGTALVTGTLNSTAATQFRVEFFSGPTCDPTGFGEGQIFHGSAQVTTNASGDANVNANLTGVQLGHFITTTATDPLGNTSEFSQCRAVQSGPGALQLSSATYNVNENAGVATITATRTGGNTGAVSVQYATSNGSAVAGSDYTAASGTLNWADGDTASKTFTVPITDDSLDEDDETVTLTLSNPTGGATVGSPGTATLTILDNDPQPGITIDNVTQAEGNSGTPDFQFTVSLSAATSRVITVDYTTANGTAQAGSDYTALSGTLIFFVGQTTKTIVVFVNGDTQNEPDETFFVNLSNPANAAINKAQGIGTITNDDGLTPPTLQFSATTYSVNESAGLATITATRTANNTGAVSVHYATSDGTAVAGSDYTAVSGTLSWADGDTAGKTFTIPVANDSLNELDETINLTLSDPTGGATVGTPGTATLTILDNDPQPGVTINDVSKAEGNSGTTDFQFTVSLSAASSRVVTVNYATADGTTLAGIDYQTLFGTLTFSAGETSKPITILVNGDTQNEPNETFFVNLSSPVNASISKAQGAATITNDDGVTPSALQFSAANYNTSESAGLATITATRTGSNTGAVSVQYATSDGTAVVGADYTAAAGTLVWADGDSASKTFTISVANDSLNEADETINLSLSNPTGGANLGGPGTATLTILDDDPVPGLTINDVSVAEGNNGTTDFQFTVSLSAASGRVVPVDYSTADNQALAGSDYQATSGTLIFSPGETSKTINILGNGDTQNEPNETFFVTLSNPANASITRAQGTGTIVNDDGVTPPALQFSSATYNVQEDLTALTITVTRTGDTSAACSVDYSTNDGSATQKGDFEFAAGTLRFAAGDSSKTLQVLINEDMYVEPGETFTVTLSNPSGLPLGAQSSATVTIIDDSPESLTNPIDDAQSFVHMHYHDFLNREPDANGLAFWTNEITSCGANQQCIDARRIQVSAAFFLSIEFQQTGFLVHRAYKASYGNLPGTPVPLRLVEFTPDTRALGQGVIVNQAGWEQVLENNKRAFFAEFVQRSRFTLVYPSTLAPAQFVDTLFANAGVAPSLAERTAAINEFGGAPASADNAARGRVLRMVAEQTAFAQQEFNRAVVLMEYLGYLRRNPNDSPDSNYSGYDFWLSKLNQFNGNLQNAEMIKAFITSIECRQRFGP